MVALPVFSSWCLQKILCMFVCFIWYVVAEEKGGEKKATKPSPRLSGVKLKTSTISCGIFWDPCVYISTTKQFFKGTKIYYYTTFN